MVADDGAGDVVGADAETENGNTVGVDDGGGVVAARLGPDESTAVDRRRMGSSSAAGAEATGAGAYDVASSPRRTERGWPASTCGGDAGLAGDAWGGCGAWGDSMSATWLSASDRLRSLSGRGARSGAGADGVAAARWARSSRRVGPWTSPYGAEAGAGATTDDGAATCEPGRCGWLAGDGVVTGMFDGTGDPETTEMLPVIASPASRARSRSRTCRLVRGGWSLVELMHSPVSCAS